MSTDPATIAKTPPAAASGQGEARPAWWQRWSGTGSLLLGAVSLAAFLAVFSLSIQLPKAVVFGGGPIAFIYINLPTISVLPGAGAVVLAIVALTGSKRSTKVAVIGFAVGAGAFATTMVFVAGAMAPTALSAFPNDAAPVAISVGFMPTPPAIAVVAPLLVLVAMLLWLRGIAGRRVAIAGLIMGGVPVIYWLFALLTFASGGGE